jgi:uncharacterized repeat protein (TIGR01451 family)
MKPSRWLVLVMAAALSPAAFSQSRESVDPSEAVVTTFVPGAPLQVLGGALLDLRPQLITHPGAGAGGADESRLQNSSLGMGTIGFGAQQSVPNRVADDFVVPAGGWDVNAISFYTYQTGSTTTSTITGLTFQIWNGPPNVGGSTVVFGDTTTNRLSSSTFTNIFRVTETTIGNTTRPIMAATASGLTINLPAGTYWLDWAYTGSLASGPWAPAITINGTAVTGNGLQFTTPMPPTPGAWAAALDGGTGTPAQGFPFTIEGTVPSADVSITKVAVGAGALSIGSAFSYDLTVANAGPNVAAGVTVTDSLPPEVTYVSNTCGATFAAPTLTWTIGALGKANATCTINVTVASAGSISNTATVTSTTNDPTPANGSATATVGGAPTDADVSLTKTAQGTGLNVGSAFTFTLTASNAGPGGATGVVVTDSLPASVTYVGNNCGATFAAPTLTWTIGTLANAASATCIIDVTVAQPGQISNTANITATSNDPNAANNAASAIVAGASFREVPVNSTLALLALLAGVIGLGVFAAQRR